MDGATGGFNRGETVRRRTASSCVAAPFALVLLFFGAGGAPGAERPVPASHYVDRALAENPALSAMRERIGAKRGAAARAEAFDDPKLWLGLVNVPVGSWRLDEDDMTGKEIGLSQMFPWPGMRGARGRAAESETEEAGHDLAEMRNMLRAEIRMTYAELAAARRQAEAVRRTREVLSGIVEASREAYAVGRGSQADVLKGQVAAGRMTEMLIALESRERILGIRLNTLAALPPETPVPPLEEPGEFAFPHGTGELMAIYRAERPARKAAGARVGRGEAMTEMARHARHPEFELSLSYMQRDAMPDGTNRPDMVSAMVMVNLPLWKETKVGPGIREAEAERRMASQEVARLDIETENRVAGGIASLAEKSARAALFRTALIPQAEQAVEAGAASYEAGRTGFPMLLESVMALLDLRREYAAMVGEMHAEKARLEAAVGRDLEAAPVVGG